MRSSGPGSKCSQPVKATSSHCSSLASFGAHLLSYLTLSSTYEAQQTRSTSHGPRILIVSTKSSSCCSSSHWSTPSRRSSSASSPYSSMRWLSQTASRTTDSHWPPSTSSRIIDRSVGLGLLCLARRIVREKVLTISVAFLCLVQRPPRQTLLSVAVRTTTARLGPPRFQACRNQRTHPYGRVFRYPRRSRRDITDLLRPPFHWR